MKPLITPKAEEATYLIVACIIAALCLWAVYGVVKVFSSPGVPVPVSKARPGRIMTVYAYDAGACCCAPFADGITASGVPAVGRICAAPPEYPFGTRLWIEGLGEYVVQDRGGDIKGNRLDILFATHAEAKAWGVQYLMVKEIR